MKNLKIKIVTGFRQDQIHAIDADEAHKAYYLFLNPEARGVFNNGLAIRGDDIKSIEPDYNATMGWAPTYKIDDYDWGEIYKNGVDKKLRDMLHLAKTIAVESPAKINTPLSLLTDDKLILN